MCMYVFAGVYTCVHVHMCVRVRMRVCVCLRVHMRVCVEAVCKDSCLFGFVTSTVTTFLP